MLPVGFELTISAGERPQTYNLDRVASGNGGIILIQTFKKTGDTFKWKIVSIFYFNIIKRIKHFTQGAIYISVFYRKILYCLDIACKSTFIRLVSRICLKELSDLQAETCRGK
jgi:hypothetical protein